MVVVAIVCIFLCVIILGIMLAFYDLSDEQAFTIFITVVILAGLCLCVGAMSNEPEYYYEGMRVEKEDIDFSEFIMTYDEEKNCYNIERKEK